MRAWPPIDSRPEIRDEEVKTDPRYSGKGLSGQDLGHACERLANLHSGRVSQLRNPHQEGVDRSAEPATVALHLTAALESIDGRD
jgi:hypothetical protein